MDLFWRERYSMDSLQPREWRMQAKHPGLAGTMQTTDYLWLESTMLKGDIVCVMGGGLGSNAPEVAGGGRLDATKARSRNSLASS